MAANFRFTSETLEPTLPHINIPSYSDEERLERERIQYLSDPNKVERIVSHLMKEHVPEKKKEKLAMSSTLAKVESLIPSDDPRKGMGSKIMDEATVAMMGNPDLHPLEVIKKVYDRNVEEKKVATYKYLEDKEKGFLGLPGFGSSIFTGSVIGSKYASMPGYDEYKRKKEEYNKTHFNTDEFSSIPEAATWGSMFTGGAIGLEKFGLANVDKAGKLGKVGAAALKVAKYLPTGFRSIPNPYLRLGLTALAAIPEFWAFEATKQAVTKAPGMEEVPDLPKEVLGFVAGGAGFSAVSKGIAKQINKWGEARYSANNAVKKMVENPGIKEILNATNFDEKYRKQTERLFSDSEFSMRNVPGSAAAKAGSARAKISTEQLSRIESKVNEGIPLEEAVGQVLTQDRVLGTLDAIKTNKFFDELLKSSADKQEKMLKNRIFRDAINRGLDPDEAVSEVQKATAKWSFDNVINWANQSTVSHAPEVSASLRTLGYSDETIEKIPVRIGKSLFKRQQVALNAEREKFEIEASKLFHEEAGTATEATLINPHWHSDINKARTVVAETETLTKNIKPEIIESESPKIVSSGGRRPLFGEDEPARDASEDAWYRWFKKQAAGIDEGATEANMFTYAGPKGGSLPDTVRRIEKLSPNITNAYTRVFEERLKEFNSRFEKVIDEDKKIVTEIIDKTVNEPVEAVKTLSLTDDIATTGLKNVAELEAKVKAKEARMKALREGYEKLYGKPPKYSAEAGVAKELEESSQLTKGTTTKTKKDFDRESVDLYTRMSQGKISQDEYDEALNALLDEHGGGWGKMMAAITAGASALVSLSAFAPNDAEAANVPSGVVTNANVNLVKGMVKDFKGIVSEIIDKKLFVPSYVKGSFDFGNKGYAISVVPSLSAITRKKKIIGQNLLSPNVIGEVLYNARDKYGNKLPTNPMPEIANRTSIAMAHTMKGLELSSDIMFYVPDGKSHQKEVAEAMKPLLGMNEIASKVSFHQGNIERLEEMIEGMIDKKSKAKLSEVDALVLDGEIEKIMLLQDASRAELKKLNFKKEEFDKQWRAIAEGLAEKYPSSRIAFALEGEGMSANDPWVLKHMTDEEKVAVGHFRRFFDKIAEYLIDIGEKPILEKPYIHHATHPESNYAKLKNDLSKFALDPENILPLARLYHRNYNSKQMMPDIQYIMQEYLPDIFKRIEMIDFWKKGKPHGWHTHMMQLEQLGWRGPADFMKSIQKGFLPEDRTTFNDLARQIYSFEAARLLGLNPSPGFRHLMKLEANWSNFGIGMSAKNITHAFSLYKNDAVVNAAEKLTGKKMTRELETELYRQFTHAGNISAIIQDFSLYEPPKGWFEKISRGISETTGVIINNTERFDRAMSFVGALEMAGKKGMTAEQALYGLYDTILKTNFLSGAQNPSWLRNPKIRAMFMFQGTPFKIAEQRALDAWRGARGIKSAAKEFYEQLQGLRKMVKEGEQEFKWNLIKDALEAEKDVFGIPYAYQLMRRMMIIGTMITGGAALFDADMLGHVIHPPFIAFEGGIKVRLNPMLTAAFEAKSKEDEFWLSSFFKKWFNSGPMPAAVSKALRLSEDDIPKIYRDSKFRYLLGIPATKEED